MRIAFLLLFSLPTMVWGELAHAPGVYPADEIQSNDVTVPRNPYQSESWTGYEFYYDKSGLENPKGKSMPDGVLEEDREKGEDPEDHNNLATTIEEGKHGAPNAFTTLSPPTPSEGFKTVAPNKFTTPIKPVPSVVDLVGGRDSIKGDGLELYADGLAPSTVTNKPHPNIGASPGVLPPIIAQGDVEYQSPYEVENSVTNPPAPTRGVWENTIAPLVENTPMKDDTLGTLTKTTDTATPTNPTNFHTTNLMALFTNAPTIRESNYSSEADNSEKDRTPIGATDATIAPIAPISKSNKKVPMTSRLVYSREEIAPFAPRNLRSNPPIAENILTPKTAPKMGITKPVYKREWRTNAPKLSPHFAPIAPLTPPRIQRTKKFEDGAPLGDINSHPTPYRHVYARTAHQNSDGDFNGGYTNNHTMSDVDRIAEEFQISAREYIDHGVQELGESTKDIIMEESGKDPKLLGRNSKRCCSCCPEGKPVLRQVHIPYDPSYSTQQFSDLTSSTSYNTEPLVSRSSIDGNAYLPPRDEQTYVRHPFQEYQPQNQYPQSFPNQAPCGCQPQQNCCPPVQPCCLPQIPCCPPIPCCPQPRICCQPVCTPPPTCCTISFQLPTIPVCGRACPSCPCRRRVHRARRLKRTITGAGCTQCSRSGEPWRNVHHRVKRQSGCSGAPTTSGGCTQCGPSHQRSPRVKRFGCLPCLGRKKRNAENQHIRVKRMGCLPCLNGGEPPRNCSSCSNMGHLVNRIKRSFFGCNQCPQTCPCRAKRSVRPNSDVCDSSCCDYSSCKRSKKNSILEFLK